MVYSATQRDPKRFKGTHSLVKASRKLRHDETATGPGVEPIMTSAWEKDGRTYHATGNTRPKRSKQFRAARLRATSLIVASCLLVVYVVVFGYSVWWEDQDANVTVRSAFASSSSSGYSRQSSFFVFDRDRAEALLQQHGPSYYFRPITAFLEAPLNDTIPNTGSRGNLQDDNDPGTPPDVYSPLPLRTSARPEALRRVAYSGVRTCHDMPGKFPIDRGLQYDGQGQVIVWNLGGDATPDDFAERELPHCPVESDPWLPWIHDMFPSPDGSRIEVIAQNKRKCRTGRNHDKDLERLAPQAALLQSVSVQRLPERQARALAPELWYPHDNDDDEQFEAPRYRLAPYNESSPDGMETRFICRFHATSLSDDIGRKTVVLGETLSQYPFNYEFGAYRKLPSRLLSAKGKDTLLFLTTTLRFQCPVPNVPGLQESIANGSTVLSDGSPTMYLDLVPIRTSARYHDEFYLRPDQIGPPHTWTHTPFDPVTRWGPNQVVPRVEASGRWANLPVCFPPHYTSDADGAPKLLPHVMKQPNNKPHVLSVCLWASTEFKTRGGRTQADTQTDTETRFREWLEFHRLVGVDHVYLFDNSGAHTNETSLAQVASMYPDFVTRIDWPATPCNNNPPMHDSCGERSSQYAAENACRTRYAPFTKWIVSIDTDEYLVPSTKDNLKDVLAEAEKGGTKILSFFSSRNFLRRDKCETVESGLQKLPNYTYLESYNCDSAGMPKSPWAMRAKKQVYISDYVLYHFVHFATMTQGMLETYAQAGGNWSRRNGGESAPIERRVNERTEATMIHTKLVKWADTKDWRKYCIAENFVEKPRKRCWVAFPWPDGKRSFQGNCYLNERVDQYWVPKLRQLLQL